MEYMRPDEIVKLFKKRLNESAIIDSRIETKTAGLKKSIYSVIWLQIRLENFKEAIKLLCTIQFPHFAIISGNDIGEEIELIYHFSIYYAERFKEISINLTTRIPKKNLKIPTITDLIPGAQTAEREIKEMFGVTIEGLPNLPNIFLPQDFQKGVYPLRRDEKGVDKTVRKEDEVRKVE
ncbi:NADH-quinone oxidoreductase subunit C [bacterium]|nr:NADH-quinone oxidoreductase subunit C [Candidatus Atribacteria bacterium]MBU4227833.1 NADH-quinone oxidoreductase subunit C [bacterium]MBU4362444.1 NADH-quinone oxidoreductase subunit C [bacterium]MBU4601757.1 NADH-quinone oxidoreductase subunit C [bacterium]MCG2762286.1 NADH-quinone oxidoreductase subunit C [Candidatus Atribacteria bacterium]